MIEVRIIDRCAYKLRKLLAEHQDDFLLKCLYNDLDRALKRPAVKPRRVSHTHAHTQNRPQRLADTDGEG